MPPTAWQRRVRRLFFFAGTASTAYFFFAYLIGRMRDARVRAFKERRERETIKAHFTSLLSTISFTLYALLPTLEPQLFAAYPVESTSQALQAKVATPGGGSGSPTDTGTTEPTPGSTPADSMLLAAHDQQSGDETSGSLEGSGYEVQAPALRVPAPPGTIAESVVSFAESDLSDSTSSAAELSGPHPGESWASEFSAGVTDSIRTDDDMLTASTVSQAISLPPTDTSSASPTSEISRLEESSSGAEMLPPSPPRAPLVTDPRSKKELWRDLKVQSITRAMATAYLVPLVYILTSSQLTILARTRYLADVKAVHEQRELQESERSRVALSNSWLGYFSVDAMGLAEYAERGAAAGASFLPKGILSWLPWGGEEPVVIESSEVVAAREAQLAEERAEAERLFLTYSWWLLHEGWRTVSHRVESAVNKIFGGMGLKREITAASWDALVKELRADVETETGPDGKAQLYDFTPLVVPPSPLPLTYDECPLPSSPEEHGKYLETLLAQTREHVSSPDARLLVDRGVGAMLASLSESLRGDLLPEEGRRVADLLPDLNRWSRGVWEGIPDGGVESLLALPEYEAFAALIFGDWAPR